MTDMKVGLALGSGAMRGLAHIGVIQVFEEEGIPIDMIAGSSIGAVIGGFYSCGVKSAYMDQIAQMLDARSLIDLSRSRRGLIRGEKIHILARTLTQNKDFEQADIPLCIVAVDAERSEKVYLRQGPIADAIRASSAIPGIFEPMLVEGRTLIDGGVLERVPVQAARQLNPDVIIGVDVGYRGAPRSVSSMIEIIMSATEMMEWEVAKHTSCQPDVLLMPNVARINPYSLAQAAECIEMGREEARARLDQVRQAIDSARLKKPGLVKDAG